MKNKLRSLLLPGFCFLLSSTVVSQTTLVSSGSSWKFLDNGSNQGTTWRSGSFSDASWASGNAQLGYGDGDEATVVSYGGNSSNKYITTYFRKTISIPSVSGYASYNLSVKRDDGIVLYVNGTERYRNNISGTVAYNTLASNASDDGGTWLTASLPAGTFTNGTNVIAVEIHQTALTSSDISFDMSLTGVPSGGGGATLTRGPYLQIGTPNSVYVRWRTNTANNTVVKYGTSPTSLTQSVSNTSNVTEHVIQLTGLTPNQKYYYLIGSTTQTLQGDANNFFTTAPTVGTEKKTRVWVNGDCGNASTNQTNVRNQYHNYIGTNTTDVWLLLGDNAYSSGTDAEYQTKFFDIYKDKMLKQAILWPTPGNHDYNNGASTATTVPYYSIFSVPTGGQAGGISSNNPAYYSYNYANIHFISIDSYGTVSSKKVSDTTGAQAVWLKQDLAANTQKWTIVYFHHAPYTMTSHNSDSESDLATIRNKLLRVLERYKVDLVLCGHSHGYERSKLMKGHFGNESTFNSGTHNLSSSSAKYDGSTNSCPYTKNAGSSQVGSVYVVAGSAGQLGGTQTAYPHNAMHYSNATNGGSMVLEIEGNTLNAKWICADGVIRDNFTIEKDVNKTTNLNITSGQNVVLTASWIGNYSWTPGGATTRTISVSPTSNISYTVTDGATNCLKDIYNIKVSGARFAQGNNMQDETNGLSLSVFPNPTSGETTIQYSTPFVGDVTLDLYDIQGKKIKSFINQTQDNGVYKQSFNSKSDGIPAGIYFVKLSFREQQINQKLVIQE